MLHGILGFGAHSRIHSAKILRLSEDLPIVIEIVDKSERIEAILPEIDEMIGEGLVTLEDIQVFLPERIATGVIPLQEEMSL